MVYETFGYLSSVFESINTLKFSWGVAFWPIMKIFLRPAILSALPKGGEHVLSWNLR
jgi:hypothetical protein